MASSFTILVVDDNDVNLMAYCGFLKQQGFLVIEARDGEQALAQLERVNPDLVVLDVMMPGMSGFEVLETIRRERPPEALPVIMATAREQSEDMIEAFELGANDYVTKPVDLPVLLARIQSQLRTRTIDPLGVRSVTEIEPGVIVDGKYRLESSIGKGNFGEVFRATQLALDRPVALKFLDADVEPGSDSMKRFRQEGVATCRIDHPNAVAVLDLSVTPSGLPYMVMELLEGHTLGDELAREGSLPPRRCLEILRPVCEVLAQAHELELVHRDVKPANVFMHQARHGEVIKVLDFGIAKLLRDADESLTPEGGVIGTPVYMAPERFTGESIDSKTDIYSLGVMLYETLAGRLPFKDAGGGPFKVLVMHMTEKPPPLADYCPDLPPAVTELVHEALAKDPQERPTAARLLERFAAAVES